MKLRNKKTGEVIEWFNNTDGIFPNSLAELNAEWEDYEGPKEHWCINEFGTPEMAGRFNRESIYDKSRKLIGNDFETKEEAEKAVEKLKAWKRLKDSGFSFKYWYVSDCKGGFSIAGEGKHLDTNDIQNDLDLLFGGEE